MAGSNQTKTWEKQNTIVAHQPESNELQEYLLEITTGEIGTTPTEGTNKEQEFQDYLLKTTIVEIGTTFIEGMDKDPVNYFCMTVYVRTNSGKTISIKCDKRQSIMRIKESEWGGDPRRLFSTARIR